MTRIIIKEYDSIHPDDKKYLTHNNLLSHNADISWSQSIRNLGKSYDAMCLIRNTLDSGRNCVWLRWDRKETKVAEHELVRFMNDASRYKVGRIPDSNVSFIHDKDSSAYLYFIPVKDATGVKGMDIPEIRWCVYDECIPEFYDVRTRRDEEFSKFMSLYVTLKRDTEDFRALLMSNCIDWFTGYTRAWGVEPFSAGKIRTYSREIVMETPTGVARTSYKIAFENVRPSIAMIERNLKDYAIRGEDFDIDGYFDNKTSTDYNLIGKCPDMTIPLSDRQYMRDGIYFSFRVHDNVAYFARVKHRRDLPTMVFKVGEVDYELRHIRVKDTNKWFEAIINAGVARFEDGHLYNQVVNGIYDLRKMI